MQLSYDSDCEELVVRILLKFRHEAAQLIFSHEITTKAWFTGLPIGSLIPSGATRYHRHSSSSSERVRLTHKPSAVLNSIPDWPAIVVESDFSEPLTRLRADAPWWLTKSGARQYHCHDFHPEATRQNCDREMGTWSCKSPKAAYKSCPEFFRPSSSNKAPPSQSSAKPVHHIKVKLPRRELQTYRMGSRELKTDRTD